MSDSPLVFQSSQLRPHRVTGHMRHYMADIGTEVGAQPPGQDANLKRVQPGATSLIPPAMAERGSADDLGEFYARCHGVSRAEALEAILRRSLYPHARLLRWWLLLLDPDFFAADRDYIASIGALRHRRELSELGAETALFFSQVENRRFLRRVLRLRISIRRVHALIKQWGKARGDAR